MSNCYELARHLGEEILKSEIGIKLADATYEMEQNETAMKLMSEFENYKKDVSISREKTQLSEEQNLLLSQNIAKKLHDLKENHYIKEAIKAENEFSAYVDKIFSIIKSTITGTLEQQKETEEKDCSNCETKCCKKG